MIVWKFIIMSEAPIFLPQPHIDKTHTSSQIWQTAVFYSNVVYIMGCLVDIYGK